LEREKKELLIKVRDRDEEIRGKGRFLEVILVLFSYDLFHYRAMNGVGRLCLEGIMFCANGNRIRKMR